jgi:hypothetical protein
LCLVYPALLDKERFCEALSKTLDLYPWFGGRLNRNGSDWEVSWHHFVDLQALRHYTLTPREDLTFTPCPVRICLDSVGPTSPRSCRRRAFHAANQFPEVHYARRKFDAKSSGAPRQISFGHDQADACHRDGANRACALVQSRSW